jgi:hypothetical protein
MKRFFRTFASVYLFTFMIWLAPVLRAQEKPAAKMKASAIKVEMIQSAELKVPVEFQVAMYENLIRELDKKGGFAHVYREGDRNGAGAADLVVLHSTIRGFIEGSQRKREVTTITGATTITVHCKFTDGQGKVLLERDIQGKVRFFGGNLKATYDFAKKATTLTRQNFTATEGA